MAVAVETLTLQDRADAYAEAFAQFPASHLRVVQEQGRDVLYGTWLIGNDYRRPNGYYGEHPPSYLDRIMPLFPFAENVLHVFSGSLSKGPYFRLDVNAKYAPEFVGDVLNVRELVDAQLPKGTRFDLLTADPPYSSQDAEHYQTPMINRRAVLAALANVTQPDGHLVWLDTVWPMHSKRDWITVGRICVVRSTNHRVRLVSIFQRVSA